MKLIDYLRQSNIRPYAANSRFLEKLGIGRQHLGDIAKGAKRPSPELAMRIEDATEGAVTMRELFEFYEQKQSEKPAQCELEFEHSDAA